MRARNIRNSLLSILCIVSWFVITFRIFASEDTGVTYIFVYYLLMVGLGSLGGILLLFLNILKGGKFKFLFIFNLFATWNLLLGILGLASFYSPGHTPYIAGGSIAIGIVMYRIIYSGNLIKTRK